MVFTHQRRQALKRRTHDTVTAEVVFRPRGRPRVSSGSQARRTPIVRLERLSREVPGELLAKLEYLNPGGSVKDRPGLAMIEAAEREGLLKPGGTIVEPTSGNTGAGLAMAAALRGYRCIFVMPDKMSQEKISMLRAYGAEVVITPTAVDPHSPELLLRFRPARGGDPGRLQARPVLESSNPEAHYATTGPELWDQTGGEVDAVVISVGTGGTITGVGRYFKERKPEVRIVAVDPEGSIFTADAEHPEGRTSSRGSARSAGRTRWIPRSSTSGCACPTAIPSSGATARARKGELLVGGSTGSTAWAGIQVARKLGPEARVLMMFPDSGRSYLSKFYDDNWMIQYGFLVQTTPPPAVEEVLHSACRPRGSRPRHDRLPREGGRGDRRDAALRDLAAAGRAGEQWTRSRNVGRLAAGARAPRARVPQRTTR